MLTIDHMKINGLKKPEAQPEFPDAFTEGRSEGSGFFLLLRRQAPSTLGSVVMQADKGFSLIELIIAVTVIGILSAIVYPSFMEQIRNSRRADAQSALISFANAMERYYTENGDYLGAASGGGNTGTPAASVFAAEAPLDGNTKYYDLKIFAAASSTYELRAEPKNIQLGDMCGKFTLTHTGVRGIANQPDASVTASDCWR